MNPNDDEIDKISTHLASLLDDAFKEYIEQHVKPNATRYVRVFEDKLSSFSWDENKARLDLEAKVFAKAYKELETRLFNQFDEQVLSKAFPTPCEESAEIREKFRTVIALHLASEAEEPVDKIVKFLAD